MPIYEYGCDSCGDEFEQVQGFSDRPLKKCKKCGGKLKKLVSMSSFHLKGTGWYVTDYGKTKSCGNDPIKSAKKDKKESKSDSDSSKTKKESKNKE
jgi:putative FmdB family regulatory protein